MKLEREVSESGNIRTSKPVCPVGWVVIDTYHPCPSVTPWDYYGLKHQREYSKALRDAGIDCVPMETRQNIITPRGSGPFGRVRVGDDMMPSVYEIAVPDDQAAAARVTLEAHKEAVRAWLHDGKPMPVACMHC